MTPVKYKIIHKRIHPPEADPLADSFAKAARSVQALTDELSRITLELDSSWEGGQKARFMDTFRPISPKSGEFATSTLQGIEKGFRTIQVDVEEQIPV
jgi:uncharacterized protein YukE